MAKKPILKRQGTKPPAQSATTERASAGCRYSLHEQGDLELGPGAGSDIAGPAANPRVVSDEFVRLYLELHGGAVRDVHY